MSAEETHWIEYGDPTGTGRIEATKRTIYATGPNESRDDDVTHGTLGHEALELIEEDPEVQEQLHEDGSVMLSALPDEKRDKLMATWEPEK